MKSLKRALTGEPEEERSLWNEVTDSGSCSLTYKQRIVGFLVCAGFGLFCILLSFWLLFAITFFVLVYTVGNCLLLASTFFLVGPVKQLKMMFTPSRCISSVIFLAALALTLFVAIYSGNVILCIVLVVIQFCALLWYQFDFLSFVIFVLLRLNYFPHLRYGLSYIPFAQSAVASCVRGMISNRNGCPFRFLSCEFLVSYMSLRHTNIISIFGAFNL